jgi:predicted GIY-YIG superfamily endonuclease
MSRKRDTYRYQLRDGKKIVQFGVTNEPGRRFPEHDRDGKRFTSMTVVGPSVTRESAEKWERDKIDAYERRTGHRPRYNKT